MITTKQCEFSKFSEGILRNGGIIEIQEKPSDMVDRITNGLNLKIS